MSRAIGPVFPPAGSVGARVVEWVAVRTRSRLSPNTAVLLWKLIDESWKHSTVEPLLDEAGLCSATARFRLAKKSFPAPSRWLHLGRALLFAEALRADPSRSPTAVAYQLGLSDHTALTNHLKRYFGLSARAIGPEHTVEVLLERWWERESAAKQAKAARRAAPPEKKPRAA